MPKIRLAGNVNGTGTTDGPGWSASWQSEGMYSLEYTEAFPETPTVLVTPSTASNSTRTAMLVSPNASNCGVRITDKNNDEKNCDWDFAVICEGGSA